MYKASMTKIARPTRAERNAIKTQSLKQRRAKRVTVAKRWTFNIAVKEVVHRGFTPHEDAERYFNAQTAQPRKRKMKMKDGKCLWIHNIMSGSTRDVPLTLAEKTDINSKRKATRVERGCNITQNHKEAIAIKAFMKLIDPANNLYEWKTVPGSLGTDLAVQACATTLWAPIQFKSAIKYDDEETNYHYRKTDGAGRYENMIIVAVGLTPFQ
jgi:hypothetical protein